MAPASEQGIRGTGLAHAMASPMRTGRVAVGHGHRRMRRKALVGHAPELPDKPSRCSSRGRRNLVYLFGRPAGLGGPLGRHRSNRHAGVGPVARLPSSRRSVIHLGAVHTPPVRTICGDFAQQRRRRGRSESRGCRPCRFMLWVVMFATTLTQNGAASALPEHRCCCGRPARISGVRANLDRLFHRSDRRPPLEGASRPISIGSGL